MFIIPVIVLEIISIIAMSVMSVLILQDWIVENIAMIHEMGLRIFLTVLMLLNEIE